MDDISLLKNRLVIPVEDAALTRSAGDTAAEPRGDHAPGYAPLPARRPRITVRDAVRMLVKLIVYTTVLLVYVMCLMLKRSFGRAKAVN